MEAKDLLLADLAHFGESLAKNEEVGEKRLSFFITLLTAVAGGLVGLATADPGARASLVGVGAIAAAALLVLGLVSYTRMLQRNRVTDEYKETLAFIRRLYLDLVKDDAPEAYHVPLGLPHPRWLRGGYAETFAILDGMLLSAFTYLALRSAQATLLSARAHLVTVAAALLVGAGLASLLAWWAGGKGPRGQYFRANAGAVIVNDLGRILVIERRDDPGAWQLPQGGIEHGEDPLDAARREVREETGIEKGALEKVGAYPELLAYELPRRMRSRKTGRGQVQYWFFFRYTDPAGVRPPAGSEARACEWRPLDTVVADVVDFRRPVYEHLREYARTLPEFM